MTAPATFEAAFAACPLIAILRGLTPAEAVPVGRVLLDAGFRILEVPLNSPQPLESISALAHAFPQAWVGAGTVLRRAEVGPVQAAGGRVIVSPNFDADVVGESRDLDLVSLPGVATPTEAFAALEAGATGLKLFPAEMIGPHVVKAIRAVLPRETLLLPVGGITPASMAAYRTAGADGFGIGSALYTPGIAIESLRNRAHEFIAAHNGTLRA
ncbi:2-dehydro-3-deoxy-6-phosphogalactonate aldolase [Ramlibacter sp. MMS24-I3-19]|uniref:2-dehydro-3-deoxy-6-phosphogalactonate aldolase n=1 Tax=Ramlibacter sp. MMS24-I3-19 TaxID=3416606 RepID=UPI003CFC3124